MTTEIICFLTFFLSLSGIGSKSTCCQWDSQQSKATESHEKHSIDMPWGHHLHFCGFSLLFAIVSDRSPPPVSQWAPFQISGSIMCKESNWILFLGLKSTSRIASSSSSLLLLFFWQLKSNIIWSCFAFCSYVRMTACTIGGLLLFCSSIVLLCIGQDKSSLGQTGGISLRTWTLAVLQTWWNLSEKSSAIQ